MPTHDPECAYHILYRCERCGKLSLSRGKLEQAECSAGENQ